MEIRACGTSGLKLSALGVGCWSFGGGEYWGEQDQKDVDEVVRRAVDLGITFFDTAEVYNQGRSEESLGRAIRGLSRDKLIIGSKISPSNVHPEVLPRHCEASLRRLGTDYLDFYMVHWPITPHSIRHFTDEEGTCPSVEDAFSVLRRLQQAGKIRHLGVSNFSAAKLEEAMKTGATIVANELPYSLVARAIEYEILPFCRQRKVGVVGYMPLWQGLLTDRYASLRALSPWRRRTRHFDARKNELARHGEIGAEEESWQVVLNVRNLARQLGLTTSELALKWALANPNIACVLAGARNCAQLQANVAATARPLDAEVVEKLNRATAELKKKMGLGFDFFESTGNDRTR